MLTLLLLFQLSQVPCVPSEGTTVCNCKAGQLSACAALEATDPARFAQVQETLRKAAALQAAQELARQQAMQQAQQQAAQEQSKSEVKESEAQATSEAPEPPNCNGQNHHPISRSIARALDEHPTLEGRYQPRDPRFLCQAKDEQAHCGYQQWHRDVDKEVVEWLRKERNATPTQFEARLREIYNSPEMKMRFPRGCKGL